MAKLDWVKEAENTPVYYVMGKDGKIMSIDGYINHIIVSTIGSWY